MEKIKIEDWTKGVLINEYQEDTIDVELAYQRNKKIKYLTFGICDVRASDGIRISYDFDRDGYVIEQPTKLQWQLNDPNSGDMKWKETAFIQSWALEEEQEKNKNL